LHNSPYHLPKNTNTSVLLKTHAVLLLMVLVLILTACSSLPPLEVEASKIEGKIPLTVTFTPSVTDFDQLDWDFGDGETLTSSPEDGPVTHTFTDIGLHNVMVVAHNRATNETGESVTVTVNTTQGILSHFSLTPDSLTILPAGTASFSVSAFDQFGNSLPDVQASFTVSDNAGTIDQQGNFMAGQNAGVYPDSLTVEITLDGVDLTTRATVVVRPGPLAQIIMEPQSVSTTPTSQVNFSTLAIDEFGNPLSNIERTFKADIAAGQIDASGLFTAGTRAGAYVRAVIVETSDGTATANAESHVRIDPGSFEKLILLPENPAIQAGGELNFSASALDRFGNAVEEATIVFERTSDAGQIDPNGHFVASGLAGVFREAIRVEAVAGGNNVSASTDVIVTHGVLDHVLIAPTTPEVVAAETIGFTARASDAFGNEIKTASITWESSGASGNIDEQGFLTAGAPAGFYSNSVVATAVFGGVSVETSVSVLVIPGLLTQATAVSGLIEINSGKVVQLKSPITFDRHGNVIENTTVIWSMLIAEAGTVSPSGLFAAGQTVGDYPNAVQARVSKEGDFRTTTTSVTVLTAP
jgi:PKD repeat protein